MPPSPEPQEPSTLAQSTAAYVAARGELALIEAREYAGHVRSNASRVAVGAAFAGIGYLLLLGGLSQGLGSLLAPKLAGTALEGFGGPALVACVLGLLHLVVGLIICQTRREPPAEGHFSYTRAELAKDKAWAEAQRKP